MLQLPLPSFGADKVPGRPRAFTGSGRLFGTDVSNADTKPAKPAGDKGTDEKSGRRLQRSALPFEWMSSGRDDTARSASRVSRPSFL